MINEIEQISLGYSIIIVLLSALATWMLLYIIEGVYELFEDEEIEEESIDEIRCSSESSKHSKKE